MGLAAFDFEMREIVHLTHVSVFLTLLHKTKMRFEAAFRRCRKHTTILAGAI